MIRYFNFLHVFCKPWVSTTRVALSRCHELSSRKLFADGVATADYILGTLSSRNSSGSSLSSHTGHSTGVCSRAVVRPPTSRPILQNPFLVFRIRTPVRNTEFTTASTQTSRMIYSVNIKKGTILPAAMRLAQFVTPPTRRISFYKFLLAWHASSFPDLV